MQNNIAARITAELPAPVIAAIFAAGKAAGKRGFGLYMVGGAVRDLLLWRASKDIDVMVEGDALQIAQDLREKLGVAPTIHTRFGTATFKLGDYRLDLATCRSETYARPGALPTVKPGTIQEDLFRRDFTVNTMAIRVDPGHFGKFIDLYDGQRDLEHKLIRVLHGESFRDDATRIMRAVRYEQRLQFKIEPVTLKLLRRDLELLDTISGDRLRHEVLLWLEEPQKASILRRAHNLGILQKLQPGLSWSAAMARAFHTAGSMSPDLALGLYFALLTCGLDEDQINALLARLNVGGELADVALQAFSLKSRLGLLDRPSVRPSRVYSILKQFDAASIMANALCTGSRRARENCNLYLEKLRFARPALKGAELIAMGVPGGPKIGEILVRLLAARLDGHANTKADEEKLVHRLLRRS